MEPMPMVIFITRVQQERRDFFRYDIAGNSWTVLAATPAVTTDTPVAFNANDNKLYMLRSGGPCGTGNSTRRSGRRDGWDHSRSSIIPEPSGQVEISSGNGVTGAGSYVYAMRGGAAGFYRYNVSLNTWTAMNNPRDKCRPPIRRGH